MGGWLTRADHGASAEQLARLSAICPIALPQSYLDMLAEANGGEAGLSVDPLWLVIYDVDEVVAIAANGHFRDHFPDHFLFGGSGGSDAFAFDTTPERAGQIVAIEVGDEENAGTIRPVADDFDGLLALIDT